jgi:hypothetical protein
MDDKKYQYRTMDDKKYKYKVSHWAIIEFAAPRKCQNIINFYDFDSAVLLILDNPIHTRIFLNLTAKSDDNIHLIKASISFGSMKCNGAIST